MTWLRADKLRACRHRAFEHTVIIGIVFHDIKRDGGVYALGELIEARRQLVKPRLRPEKLIPQHSENFVEQGT